MTMQFACPERSLEQRMTALQRANEIRSKRAELKREIKAGRTRVRAVLLEPPDYMESMKVFDLILCAPKYGRVKVNNILALCRISPSKTLGGLSERQRAELHGMLRP
jgi:23S rRNA A1618 N6-methylase RlmF